MKNLYCYGTNLNKRLVFFEAGSGDHFEAKGEHELQTESPAEKAEKKIKSELGHAAMSIVRQYQDLFSDEVHLKDPKKVDEFITHGKNRIKSITQALSSSELSLLKAGGKYSTAQDFVNPFKVGDKTIYFRVKINDKSEIEPVVTVE